MAYTTINKSTDYFNTKLWTGDDTSPRSLTGIGFQPDWTIIKKRNTAASHVVFDAVRTAGSTKGLATNSTALEGLTATEGTTANYGYVSSFDSDGFTVTAGATQDAYVNNTSDNYVSWNWKANGAGVSNTDGSITSTVSANTTSGFSIIKYTGTGSNASIGTGLGAIPHMAIFKRTDTSGFNWFVYHRSLGAGKFITLDTNLAEESSTSIWQNTTPTSSVITLGGDGGVNASGGTYICYAFTEKKAFSAMGSYIGNGSTDGSFIYTNGMKPSFIMIKRTDAVGDWGIFDNKREGYNDETNRLKPNASDAEEDDNFMDILSNGFKLRLTSSSINASGGTYIYLAFGQTLVGSNNVPCTAR